jgi:hypothetical protein
MSTRMFYFEVAHRSLANGQGCDASVWIRYLICWLREVHLIFTIPSNVQDLMALDAHVWVSGDMVRGR